MTMMMIAIVFLGKAYIKHCAQALELITNTPYRNPRELPPLLELSLREITIFPEIWQNRGFKRFSYCSITYS